MESLDFGKYKYVYYAHCVAIYDCTQETEDMAVLRTLFPNHVIYNPNNPEAVKCYNVYGMQYFFDIVGSCEVLVFRALPDGHITAGVADEIQCALDNHIPVIEMPSLFKRRLDIDQTKSYLKEIGAR